MPSGFFLSAPFPKVRMRVAFPFLTALVLFSAGPAAAETLRVGSFSSGDLAGWEVKSFKGETRYELVRDGGVLIYATCSLLREENEEQVTAFLARHPDFRQRALPPEWPTGPGDVLRLYPARHGTDGFFAATLERVKATA